ncbi:MAG: HAD-IC family P-type ATPase, partial [Chloroflexi bacterium]|nr:HAD-IC family P-type ATPase [Chloroflexota bacterium]
ALQAGIDEVHAGLLPQDKVNLVADLKERYGSVAMVGDGVNDAPAMAQASVGIAMGVAGTDAALETADVALMNDDLSRLPWMIHLGRRALGIVRANIALSLAIKALFLVLAIAGVSTLWMAVLADTGTSLLVSMNGLRMLRFRD